jgi:hypothetical protein
MEGTRERRRALHYLHVRGGVPVVGHLENEVQKTKSEDTRAWDRSHSLVSPGPSFPNAFTDVQRWLLLYVWSDSRNLD